MAKEMVYFNATKQIETITIHYNKKLDGVFVENVAKHIKEIAKKMSRVDLKKPREFEEIRVFVYPSKKLFNSVFAGEIEKRLYSRRHSLEDLYLVIDSDGNIHIVSPRGMSPDKVEALKKILVMKVLGEYMDEKQKQSAEKLLKEVMKPTEYEKEQQEEVLDEDILEEQEELEILDEQDEEELEELDEEELEEIIETELIIDQIDESEDEIEEELEDEKNKQSQKESIKSESQEWLSIGWLGYVKGKLRKPEDIKRFADNISKNGVRKLSKLSKNGLFESYNYSQEYACALVEYVVETYGMKKFIEFYEQPKNIKGVFGVSKFIFENQMKAFIRNKYTDKNMLSEMDDMRLDEVIYSKERLDKIRDDQTVIGEGVYFTKGKGVIFESYKEIQAPEIKEKI